MALKSGEIYNIADDYATAICGVAISSVCEIRYILSN